MVLILQIALGVFIAQIAYTTVSYFLGRHVANKRQKAQENVANFLTNVVKQAQAREREESQSNSEQDKPEEIIGGQYL